jgi:hypothetical protein
VGKQNPFEANYDRIAVTRRIFHPHKDMVAFCVLGPRPEYRIVDKGLYGLEPQPEYRINNLDNKVYPGPAKYWLQFIVQFVGIFSSDRMRLARSWDDRLSVCILMDTRPNFTPQKYLSYEKVEQRSSLVILLCHCGTCESTKTYSKMEHVRGVASAVRPEA